MDIRVLGSAAGGGFPQWNCNCANCHGLRSATMHATPRTQSSIAVSEDGKRWLLINASPDIRTQINATPALQPVDGPRGSGIAAILLVDAQIDHTTGLLSLREGDPLVIYCTDQVEEDLSRGFPVFPLLSHYCGVQRRRIEPDSGGFGIPEVSGLTVRAVSIRGKAPPYSPHRHDPHPGDNIALSVEDSAGHGLFYAPGLAQVDTRLRRLMASADCIMVDGTFWTDDEMHRRAVGSKHAADMGHLPQSGERGMVSVLSQLEGRRRILIHINNTNPILDENSEQRAALCDTGIEVAFDGMEIRL